MHPEKFLRIGPVIYDFTADTQLLFITLAAYTATIDTVPTPGYVRRA